MIGLSLGLGLQQRGASGGTPTPTPAPSWSVQPWITVTSLTPGGVATAHEGTILNGTHAGWQWMRGNDDIEDETGETYTFTEDDLTFLIRARELGDGPGGQASATSSPVGPIVSDGELATPLVVIDHFARTIALDMEPQDGVTYTVYPIDHTGTQGTALGTLDDEPLDVSTAVAVALEVVATRGEDTATSKRYLLDAASLLERVNMADVPDNADFSAANINGVAGAYVRGAGNAGTYRNEGGALVQRDKSAATSYRRGLTTPGIPLQSWRGRIGIRGDANADYRLIQINRGGTNYLYMRMAGSGQLLYDIRANANGSVVQSGGTISWAISDGDSLYVRPCLSLDGSTLYYNFYLNGTPQISSNGGRGFAVSNKAGMSDGDDVILLSDAQNASSGYNFPWPRYYFTEVRGCANATFALNQRSFTAPLVGISAKINISAFYSGAHDDVTMIVFDLKTGETISDFFTVATNGDGTVSTQSIDFDHIEGNGQDLAVGMFDPLDPSGTFSVIPVGTAPIYGELPASLDEVEVGTNLGGKTATRIFQDEGYFARWDMLGSSNNRIEGFAAPTIAEDGSTRGNITGVIPDDAWAAGVRKYGLFLNGTAKVGHGDGGLHDVFYVTDVDTDDFPMGSPVGAVSNIAPYSIGAAGGTITAVEDTDRNGYIPVPGYTAQQVIDNNITLPPDGLQVGIVKQGGDRDLLLKPQVASDFGSAGGGFKFFRRMQALGCTEDYTPQMSAPFYSAGRMMDQMPSFSAKMAEEAGHSKVWFNIKLPGTVAGIDEMALYLAADYKASGTTIPLYIAISNERWNYQQTYPNNWQHVAARAVEAGAYPLTGGPVPVCYADRVSETYLRIGDTTMRSTLPAGHAVFGRARNAAAGDNWFVIIQALDEDVPAGTTLPTTFAAGTEQNGMRVIGGNVAPDGPIMRYMEYFSAKIVGRIRNIMRTGIVPGRPELNDPSVALGNDMVYSIHEVWQGHSASFLADVLLQDGGTGRPAYLDIDRYGGSHYIDWNIDWSSTPGGVGWGAQAITGDYENAVEGYFTSLFSRLPTMFNAITAHIHGVAREIYARGGDLSLVPGYSTYEGGIHQVIDCASNSDAVALRNFINDYILTDDRSRQLEYEMYTGLALRGVREIAQFRAYEQFDVPPSNVKSIQSFFIERWPNYHGYDSTRSKRWDGITEALAYINSNGAP